MVGHGGPKTSPRRHWSAMRTAIVVQRCRWALVVWVVLASWAAAADDLRLRIAWGGASPRLWQGSVSISEGLLSDLNSLGVEADQPGSMWIEEDSDGRRTLQIRQRSPRGYDGVDISVSAPKSAKLAIQLTADDEASKPFRFEVALGDLLFEPFQRELDQRGNRLMVLRAPGDALRIRPSSDRLVFAPGETFRAALEPRALPLADGGRARIKIQLLDAEGREIWSDQHEVRAGRETPIPLEIVLPDEEGVYDVVLGAVQVPNWSQAVRQPLNWNRVIAERRVQLLVLARRSPETPRSHAQPTMVVEIDPANPRWFDKIGKLPQLQLTKGRLSRWSNRPLGNGCFEVHRHALGELARLKPNAESPDVSWEAYWLPIAQPGRPHILEVDYPSDVSQTLGLSVMEPDASGALRPIGVDSGVSVEAESRNAPRWRRHRMFFWPQSAATLVLAANGRDDMPALYGKIRALACDGRLPAAEPQTAVEPGRLWAAYLDRPLFPEIFSARESLDPWSGRSLDDWRTFYEGGSRLVEYLRHAGYNGLMLAALADGSSIYPSELAAPTPRYDTGVFFSTGQDPIRKDVLEMLFRLFDREGLQLAPMVEFAAPLPELEAICRAGGSAAEGLRWIGPEGIDYCQQSPPLRGLAPYYNTLHPRVQQAMLGVLGELIDRYARHPSFAGVAVRLSGDGYAQLLGPDWGLDDATIARFERDARLHVLGEGPSRHARRAAFLAAEPQRRAWLEWRAGQLAAFYRRAAERLAAIRPGAKLYLAGAGLFDAPELAAALRPTLPRRTSMASALLRVGIDPGYFQDDAGRIVLMRPERIPSTPNLGAQAAQLEIRQTTDFDRCFQTAAPANLFFHPPREVRIESFDAISPFKPAATWLVSQPTPAGQENRRRFIRELAAMDACAMADGGWVLPMGQEDSIRDISAAFRALPAIRFETIGNRQPNDAVQPVVFRAGAHGGRAYLYALNDAPFAAAARIHVQAGADCRIEELSGMRKIAPLRPDAGSGMYWEVELEPHDLVAVRLSDSGAQFSQPRAAWSSSVETALGAEIRQLGARAAALRQPPPLNALQNADFELPAARDAAIPEWAAAARDGASVRLDKEQARGGRQSVRLASDGAVACLVSRPIATPTTGRLAMSVWLRTSDAQRQPPLRLAIDGKLFGRDYYRFAPLGQSAQAGQNAAPIASAWGQYIFQIDDLPLEGLASIRVRIDLMGAGEVWADDVQLYGLAFSKPELLELSKLIALADVKLQNGQVGDCLRLLDGYWPRFLKEYVPLSPGATPPETATAATPQGEKKPPERSGWLNRMKDLLPESLRF